MGLFDGCLLASDIDGTLISSGYINPKNIEKIEFFINEGGIFVLSTGRSFVAFDDVLEKVKQVSYSIALNGCIIYDYNKADVIFSQTLPASDFEIVNKVLETGINVGIEIHTENKVYTINRTKNTDLHQVYEKFVSPDISFEEVVNYNWNKVLYIFDNSNDREKLKKILSAEKTNCTFIDTCAIIDGKLQNYYEQIPNGVSKAIALDKLCKRLNINNSRLFAIGDYYNDLEMLNQAYISAVPIASPEEVKKIADYITVECNEGAVADFIDFLTSKLSAGNRI